jgi:aspartate/tyrosine/aromatic aminotransferase
MTDPYRVLVTGSRDWLDVEAIWQAMGDVVRDAGQDREIVIVHGACPRGADWHADRWARLADARIERHPADWARHGKAAGFRRNAEMVALGADVALAFIRNGSRGASHTAALAEKAGIPTRRFTA